MEPSETRPPMDLPSVPTPPALPEGHRPKILIIDDELGPRESIRMSLESFYECLAVDDGFKGLDALDAFQPDMLILDLRMPKIDGIEILRRVREKGSDVEVMLLTAYGSLRTAQRAIRYGVFDYLEKPFDLHELRATVARAIERRQKRIGRETRYDDMEQLLGRLKRDLSNFDRLARIGRLSAGIVHEMKNPLTVILGYTQILLGRLKKERAGGGVALSEESARYLTIIEQETVRCTQIARQLLSYSSADRDARQRTTLYELVSNIQTLVQPQCSVNDVVLTAEPAEEPVLLEVNVGQVHDVLLNLCMNAFEAMGGPGTLTLVGRVVRRAAPDLEDLTEAEQLFLANASAERFGAIEVRDSGPGIPPEVLPRIFEPFFTTKESGEGTGLGLSLCKEHVEAHGGTINAVRTGPDGTTLRLLLPAITR
jgi:signal transduction histidine kinase